MTTVVERYEDQTSFERVPPQDVAAEQAVLGGMLLSRRAVAEVMEVLAGGSDFYKPAHETIFSAIAELERLGEDRVDAITVANRLDQHGDLKRCGGLPYLHMLINSVPTAANAGYYAEIVRDHAIARRLVEAGTRIVQMGHEAGEDVEAMVDAAAAEVQAVVAEKGRGDGPLPRTSIGDAVVAFLDDLEKGTAPCLPLPWSDFKYVMRIAPKTVTVVAGLTGMGKTVVLLDMARCVGIKHKMRTLFVSLEMSKAEVSQRVLAAEAGVPLHHLVEKELVTADDEQRIARKLQTILDAPLTIVDSTTVTLATLRAELRWLQSRGELPEAVFVDYIQIIEPEDRNKNDNRQAEVSKISRHLKLLAGDFNIPIIIGAQLNREALKRADKVPQLGDLRESGSIEQDASYILMLHREDYFVEDSARAGEMDLFLRKNRQGPTCHVTVAFQGHYARTADMAQA